MKTVITPSIKASRYIFKHDTDIADISGRLIRSQLTWRKLIATAVLFSFSKIQLHLNKSLPTAQEKNANGFVIHWHKHQSVLGLEETPQSRALRPPSIHPMWGCLPTIPIADPPDPPVQSDSGRLLAFTANIFTCKRNPLVKEHCRTSAFKPSTPKYSITLKILGTVVAE